MRLGLGRRAAEPELPPFEAPELDPVQRRMLDSLRERGVATISFDELFGDAQLWRELSADMDGFVERAVRVVPVGLDQPETKDQFLIRRFRKDTKGKTMEQPRFASDSPWLRFAAGPRLLDVVNAYRDMRTKLVDYDHWYTVPFPGEYERVKSQQWHRDPEDHHVVKVFLYFSDVDEEAGPFEYVQGSTGDGPYARLWPWGEGESWYPPVDELEARIPESDRLLLTGPAGTIVVCDTSGFHRGGYARTKPRILSTHTYVSPMSTWGRRFKIDWRDGELPTDTRYALT